MRIKLFAIGIAMIAMTGITACGEDEVDAPSDGMEQKDPSEGDNSDNKENPDDPNKSDNPDEGTGEDPSPFVPPTIVEPLTDYIRPMYTPGKRWVIESNHGDSKCQTNTMEYIGETEVLGYPAKIRATFDPNGKIFFECYVREDADGTEYMYWSYPTNTPGVFESSFKVSFTLTPGENRLYYARFFSPVVIVGRGTVVLQGIERRALKVWASRLEPIYDYWVEGIGSLYGYWARYNDPTASYVDPTWRYDRILQCYDGDKLIYDYREFRDELYTPIEDYPMIDLRNSQPNR